MEGLEEIVYTERNGCSFRKAAGGWLDSLKPQIKESTIVKYTNILDLYLFPEYGERQVSEISRGDVIAFSNRLLTAGGAEGAGLSPKTVTGIISVMKGILRHASQEEGYPVADIRRISVKQPQRSIRVLTLAEQQRLNSHLRLDPTLCNLGILLSLYTGLRIGELCALQWGDILFEEQSLHVHRTMQRLQTLTDGKGKTAVLISTPKSDCSVRKIPIPDGLFRLLAENRYPADTFFLTGSTHRYMEPRTMQNRFKALMSECDIHDTHFHTLRHTFATRCVELGFDVKSLSEILGHATVNITMNRYVHPSMELKQKNMNMLSDLFAAR